MRTVPHNLQNAFYNLKKSKLVREKIVDDNSLNYFESTLNSSLPKNEHDYILYYFIKNLFYNNKQKFYNFVNYSDYDCLILYTDNMHIVKRFNIADLVYIKWDKENKLYTVSKKIL
jgi:hypothetical protein